MNSQSQLRALIGSEPVRPVGAARHGLEAPGDHIITLSIRTRRSDLDLDQALEHILDRPPILRRHLSPTRLQLPGPYDESDIDLVSSFFQDAGFEIIAAEPAAGSFDVTGSFLDLCGLLRVEPFVHQGPYGPVRSHRGPLHLPSELADRVEAVLGLDDHPVAWPHNAVERTSDHHPVNALDVAELYDFPAGDGSGQKVGILELGGGFHPQDLEHYCSLTGIQTPEVTVREVAGGANRPADHEAMAATLAAYGMTARHQAPGRSGLTADGGSSVKDVIWTIETSLDLELVATFAPKAQIVLYFAPNNSRGKVQALQTALDDGCTVISVSFGARERGIARAYVRQLEKLLKRAAVQGVTVCCSSGDGGYLEYPASSPFATACGGTSLHDEKGRPRTESVWNEAVPVPAARLMLSTGGVSALFDQPPWQQHVDVLSKTGLAGRGVPDVSAKADLASGYRVVAGGEVFATGGTSAAAPLWAGLAARVNQHVGSPESTLGHLPSLLYSSGWDAATRDITVGRSGSYRACAGWDPCTGLGSPHGTKLLELAMRD